MTAGRRWPAALLLTACITAPVPAVQAEPARPATRGPATGFALPGSGSEPIRIDADRLEFDYRKNVVVFRGDVVTTQGEVVMRSAALTATFAPGNRGVGAGRLAGVVAEGDVRITQGVRVAEGRRAEFNQANRTLVLTGDAVLHEGPNQVTGERVVVYLDEDRSVVEGTQKRVKAILVPDRAGPGGPAPAAPVSRPSP
jgi:lipopolysaccharide export system protein LptA